MYLLHDPSSLHLYHLLENSIRLYSMKTDSGTYRINLSPLWPNQLGPKPRDSFLLNGNTISRAFPADDIFPVLLPYSPPFTCLGLNFTFSRGMPVGVSPPGFLYMILFLSFSPFFSCLSPYVDIILEREFCGVCYIA